MDNLPRGDNPPAGTTQLVERSLIRLAEGDSAAREELFLHARRRLVALTRFMRGDLPGVARLEDTDDVLQESLIRLCRAIGTVCPATPRDFFGLAALQIRRELCDLARRVRRTDGQELVRYDVHIDSGSSGESGHQIAVTEEASQIAEWGEFHAMIETLPERERQAFDLLWYNDLSHTEAAAVMQVSDRQLRRYWIAARLRLQKLLPQFFDGTPAPV